MIDKIITNREISPVVTVKTREQCIIDRLRKDILELKQENTELRAKIDYYEQRSIR